MKMGVAYVNVCVLRRLKKEGLAWIIDKWLQASIKCYLKQLYH